MSFLLKLAGLIMVLHLSANSELHPALSDIVLIYFMVLISIGL